MFGTAGNKGIGQGIVLKLAKEGYKVYASARSEDKMKETLELTKGYDVEPVYFDVRDYEDVQKKIRELGHLDCAVNCAGLSIVKEPIEKISMKDWTEILDTNVKGCFAVIQAAMKLEKNPFF